MPPPPAPERSADPTKSAGHAGDPVLPCETNDVELVSDLDEPNGLELDIRVEEDEPVALEFTARAIEPGGEVVTLRLPVDDETAP